MHMVRVSRNAAPLTPRPMQMARESAQRRRNIGTHHTRSVTERSHIRPSTVRWWVQHYRRSSENTGVQHATHLPVGIHTTGISGIYAPGSTLSHAGAHRQKKLSPRHILFTDDQNIIRARFHKKHGVGLYIFPSESASSCPPSRRRCSSVVFTYSASPFPGSPRVRTYLSQSGIDLHRCLLPSIRSTLHALVPLLLSRRRGDRPCLAHFPHVCIGQR